MNKFYWHTVSLFVAMLVALALLYTGLNLWPYKVAEVTHTEVLTPYVKAGEEIIYQVSFCKYLDTQGKIERILRRKDGAIAITLQPLSAVTPGCYENFKVKVPVPENSLPGIYTIQTTTVYKVNLIKEITVQFETPAFEIVE